MFSVRPREYLFSKRCCVILGFLFRICNHGSAPGNLRQMVYLSALYTTYCSRGMLVGRRRIFYIFLVDGCFFR